MDNRFEFIFKYNKNLEKEVTQRELFKGQLEAYRTYENLYGKAPRSRGHIMEVLYSLSVFSGHLYTATVRAKSPKIQRRKINGLWYYSLKS